MCSSTFRMEMCSFASRKLMEFRRIAIICLGKSRWTLRPGSILELRARGFLCISFTDVFYRLQQKSLILALPYLGNVLGITCISTKTVAGLDAKFWEHRSKHSRLPGPSGWGQWDGHLQRWVERPEIWIWRATFATCMTCIPSTRKYT